MEGYLIFGAFAVVVILAKIAEARQWSRREAKEDNLHCFIFDKASGAIRRVVPGVYHLGKEEEWWEIKPVTDLRIPAYITRSMRVGFGLAGGHIETWSECVGKKYRVTFPAPQPYRGSTLQDVVSEDQAAALVHWFHASPPVTTSGDMRAAEAYLLNATKRKDLPFQISIPDETSPSKQIAS